MSLNQQELLCARKVAHAYCVQNHVGVASSGDCECLGAKNKEQSCRGVFSMACHGLSSISMARGGLLKAILDLAKPMATEGPLQASPGQGRLGTCSLSQSTHAVRQRSLSPQRRLD